MTGTTQASTVVPMALNVKDEEAVRLAGRVAAMTGESKTRAIRVALEERLERLREQETPEQRKARIMHWLEHEVWPTIPAEHRNKPLSKEEREEILGYNDEGYFDH